MGCLAWHLTKNITRAMSLAYPTGSGSSDTLRQANPLLLQKLDGDGDGRIRQTANTLQTPNSKLQSRTALFTYPPCWICAAPQSKGRFRFYRPPSMLLTHCNHSKLTQIPSAKIDPPHLAEQLNHLPRRQWFRRYTKKASRY